VDILFYHLERQPMEKVLPLLLEKTLERGWRAVVELSSEERADQLDQVLWTWRDDSFLPHARAGGEMDADQPILLTLGKANPNGAEVRFYVDRAVPEETQGYTRLVYLFDGHDPDAIAEARAAWRALKDKADLTYWQQGPEGGWVKKA
jgi:DNA polymerase-3 subunit chi